MSDLDQLSKELREWEGKLHDRQVDEERRAKQQKKARRRAVRARGGPLAKKMADAYRAAKRRLHATQVAIAEAQAAISKKKRQIRAKKRSGAAKALFWCRKNLYVTESPAGSNRGGRITNWQKRLGVWLVGTPWCGTFCANALLYAGVRGVTYRLASVSLIEDDARARRGPFSGWGSAASAKPGDLVVLFGRGVHVEMVREVRSGYLLTYGGNTSSGDSGSQANGGGSYPRARPFNVVRGVAHVHY